jgi:hypothetical protein
MMQSLPKSPSAANQALNAKTFGRDASNPSCNITSELFLAVLSDLHYHPLCHPKVGISLLTEAGYPLSHRPLLISCIYHSSAFYLVCPLKNKEKM